MARLRQRSFQNTDLDQETAFEINLEQWLIGRKPFLFVIGLPEKTRFCYGRYLAQLTDKPYIDLDKVELTLCKRHGHDRLKHQSTEQRLTTLVQAAQSQSRSGVIEGIQLLERNWQHALDQPLVVLKTQYPPSVLAHYCRTRDALFQKARQTPVFSCEALNERIETVCQTLSAYNTIEH